MISNLLGGRGRRDMSSNSLSVSAWPAGERYPVPLSHHTKVWRVSAEAGGGRGWRGRHVYKFSLRNGDKIYRLSEKDLVGRI